jgi:hypothetical protein
METARAGDPYAQFLIAQMHESGDGMPKNLPEARSWYQKSAEKDFKDSQIKLGEFYTQGYGMEQPDPVEAYAWYNLAKPPLGINQVIEDALNSLRSKMEKTQIAQADKRVDKYRKQFGIQDPSIINKEDLVYGPNAPKKP